MKAPDVDSPGGHDAGESVSAGFLDRLRAQEAAAWQRLLHLYGPTVYGWCRQAGVAPQDAADVQQEVFQAVARSVADFRRQRPGDSFRGWLWTITHNKVRDHWRRCAKRAPGVGGTTAHERLQQVPADESSGAATVSRPAEEQQLYRRALELIQTEFEDRTWKAFWQVAVEGRPPAEVAAKLGMTVGAVYIAKSRVLKRLRQEFADIM
jgi:RNA polymerase sigma-70 factor (ECF subfamily)